jgi:hypothetical protein
MAAILTPDEIRQRDLRRFLTEVGFRAAIKADIENDPALDRVAVIAGRCRDAGWGGS